MAKYELGYDGALYLKVFQDYISFISSGFYKLRLRRYVLETFDGFVRFKPTLSYIQFKQIIDILQKFVRDDLMVIKELLDYISEKEIYIEKRAKLGVEIKNQNSKLLEKFETYKDCVNTLLARPLREKQMWDSFYMCTMQKSANFSVPGSGKTSALLGMYAYLKSKKIVKRIVVVCPKNAFGSWIDEFNTCFKGFEELKLFNVHDSKYKNKESRKKALLYDSGNCNLFLINYEAVRSVEDEIIQIIKKDTILVFDEVHKVKLIDGEYARSAMNISKHANYIVTMTGTPIPNSYIDIYNLLHILYDEEYDDFFNFSLPMLRMPSTNEVEEINHKLQPFFCRTSKEQLGVPKANEDLLYYFDVLEVENKILNILRKKYKKNKLALLIRILQLESNPKNLLTSIDYADYKYILEEDVEIEDINYMDYSDELQKLIEQYDTSTKLTNTVETIKKLVFENKPVVVWCIFVDSINKIASELERFGIKAKCVYGEVPLEERQAFINDFKNRNIQVLITNPHTLGESVSLHDVCHDAVYFEYSYNLVHLLQSKDRIHRLGLSENQYTQYHYMMNRYLTSDGTWSLDNEIYNRLKDKEKRMIDAIDNQILETMPTTQDELDMIFTKLKL